MSIKQKILLIVFFILAVNIALVVVLVAVPRGETRDITGGQPTGDEREDGADSVQTVLHSSSLEVPEAGVSSPQIETPVESVEGSTIPHAVGEVDRVVVPVYTEGTVLDAMRAYEETGSFTFRGKEFMGLGFFVEEVQGVSPPRGRYWILYVNDEKTSAGVSNAQVRPGDVIEWNIEKSL